MFDLTSFPTGETRGHPRRGGNSAMPCHAITVLTSPPNVQRQRASTSGRRASTRRPCGRASSPSRTRVSAWAPPIFPASACFASSSSSHAHAYMPPPLPCAPIFPASASFASSSTLTHMPSDNRLHDGRVMPRLHRGPGREPRLLRPLRQGTWPACFGREYARPIPSNAC